MSDLPDYTRVLFTDLLGLSHGKVVPTERLDEPFHTAITVLTQGLDLSLVEVAGYGADVGYPDLEAVVDTQSVRQGWHPEMGVAMASLVYPKSQQPIPLDARGVLQSVIDRLAARGLRANFGFELEFYLLEDAPHVVPMRRLPVPSHRVYGTGSGADPSGVTFEIIKRAGAAGIGIEGANAEFDASQVEIPTRYRDALGAADEVFLLRELCREVAEERGMGITFMARPFADRVGSGMHANVSLVDDDGRNVLEATGGEHGLSETAMHSIGGLVAHHEALAAICAPTVNSYRRLKPSMLSGYWANWGIDNRLSTVRVPDARGHATRLEHRMADGTASPHLVAAALIAAIADGIDRRLDPGEPQRGDGDAAPNTDRHAPHSLPEALEALRNDAVLGAALGADLVRCFTALREAEWHRWLDTVTDWEQREYGRVY
ncbi:MAG: glutamine synthetase family protein [Ilumatobacteraceae bacterium]